VYGDGSQTRSFCYVSDLIDGIYRLMMSDCAEPVNIGNPDEMSILEFAERVIDVIGSGSWIVFEELPVDDPKVRRRDIGKAKDVLGWELEVGLVEGLEMTVE
jgi:dTDP-glucose 4,6-dehydratase